MAPKRKRVAPVPEEEPTPKRQLRSAGRPPPLPPSPAKASVASRRAPATPKRASPKKKKAPKEDIREPSDDELNIGSSRSPSPAREIRRLSDETNTLKVITSPPKDIELVELETPRPRRGRKPKVAAPLPEAVDGGPRNACVKKSNKRPLTPEPATPRRPTRSSLKVEVIVKRTPSHSRGSPKKPQAPPVVPHSNDDEGLRIPDNASLEMVLEDDIPDQIREPSTSELNENGRRSPEQETANADEADVSEDEVLEIATVLPTRATPLSPVDLSGPLPDHLKPCFNIYRRAILKSLHCPSAVLPQADEDSVNGIAVKQLADLIDGTVLRAEGNSCLVLGPRGSGKSLMVDACLEKVADEKPIILRLSGWVQTTDRHALREIAFQLLQQTGSSLLPDSEKDEPDLAAEVDEEENPFLDSTDPIPGEPSISLPPSSHLHALIPVLLTLNRPVVVVLDAFDLFALHPRQSLLYCLLDTVQNCRASSESRGISVIGITSRVDAVQLLEKRVKSRFSGRTIRTAPPSNLETCMTLIKTILQPSITGECDEYENEWRKLWTTSVEKFLNDDKVINLFKETFGITRDFRTIIRILAACIIRLTSNHPQLSHQLLSAAANSQRSRTHATNLHNLSYPALCLLIASAHVDTAGHKNFTFEMLYDLFRAQVRALASAPVQVNGGSIGMMRCTREVLMGAFEELSAANIFICVVAPSSNTAKQFMKYRSVVDQPEVKTVIDKAGNTNLKKWLTKNTQ